MIAHCTPDGRAPRTITLSALCRAERPCTRAHCALAARAHWEFVCSALQAAERSSWNADCALRAGATCAQLPTALWNSERHQRVCALRSAAQSVVDAMRDCAPSGRAPATSLRGRERSCAVHKTPIPGTGLSGSGRGRGRRETRTSTRRRRRHRVATRAMVPRMRSAPIPSQLWTGAACAWLSWLEPCIRTCQWQ